MKVCVFLGPTCARDKARTILDATYLPPAAQGDVYHAVQQHPLAIGIIDGAFQHVPSVWHKEILWAMTQGIHVFGSASMGALRAAELHTFGMIGVGEIFEAYRDGLLRDDDKVAVLHAPPELNCVPLSEAMVNIRATLRAAQGRHIITNSTCRQLEIIAKELFYQDRSYAAVIKKAQAMRLDAVELERLGQSLPTILVNQKEQDALAMLEELRSFASQNPKAAKPQYVLENTRTWIPGEEDTESWGQRAS